MPHIVGATTLPGSHFLLTISSCVTPYVHLMVPMTNSIYSVDTLLYSYTLPILYNPLILSQDFALVAT